MKPMFYSNVLPNVSTNARWQIKATTLKAVLLPVKAV